MNAPKSVPETTFDTESEEALAHWLQGLKQRVRFHASEHLLSLLKGHECPVCASANPQVVVPSSQVRPSNPAMPTQSEI